MFQQEKLTRDLLIAVFRNAFHVGIEGRTGLLLAIVDGNGWFRRSTWTFCNCFRPPWLFLKILLGNPGPFFSLKFWYSLKIADVVLLLMTSSGKEFSDRSFLTARCLRDCGPLAMRNFSASWPKNFLMEFELMVAIWSTSLSVRVFLLLVVLVLDSCSSSSSVENNLLCFNRWETERVETFLKGYFRYFE